MSNFSFIFFKIMKNSSTKKFKNHKNSPAQSCDQANNGAHFGEDKNEIQSTKSSLEIVPTCLHISTPSFSITKTGIFLILYC